MRNFEEHLNHLVDILDEDGRIVGQKRRRDINKPIDIFHSVHVVLITPRGELVLNVIPARPELPNLYAEHLGTTSATIRRHDETAVEAAHRAVRTELYMEDVELQPVIEDMFMLDDGRRNYISSYYAVAEQPDLYDQTAIGELRLLAPGGMDVALAIHADTFAPTLKAIWPRLQSMRLDMMA